jgi:hypothetical protein
MNRMWRVFRPVVVHTSTVKKSVPAIWSQWLLEIRALIVRFAREDCGWGAVVSRVHRETWGIASLPRRSATL